MKINLTKFIQRHLINCPFPAHNINITHCEARGNTTIIHFKGVEPLLITYSLCMVHKKLGEENFIRCHRSYIVNIQEIEEVNLRKRNFILKNGDSISISRRMLSDVTAYTADLSGFNNIKQLLKKSDL